MTLETLRSLQTRVREATGPDRELDVEIARALQPGQLWCVEHPFAPEDVAPNFTTDPDGLGACVALMHAILPGCEWDRDFRKFSIFEVPNPNGAWHEIGYSENVLANDCLTFLDAIFSAKIAELEAEQGKEKADV